MVRFVSLSFVALTVLSCVPSVTVAEGGCTLGRLFIGNKNESKLHMLDLDDGKQTHWTVGGMNPSVYSTASGLIVTTFPGLLVNNWTDGITQFHHSGIAIDDHGDHVDVFKSAPYVYDFVIRGPRASHFIDHAGYIAIFHDGYYSTDITLQQSASAYFVKQNEFKMKSSIITPIVFNPAASGGAQHGVAYAMSDNRFVMSVAHPDRAIWNSTFNSPIGFGIYDKNGILIHNISNLSDPSRNCIGYHGSGEYHHEYIHGCNAYTNEKGIYGTVQPSPQHAGILTITWNPTTDAITTRKLTYASDMRRISTIVNHPHTNNMVGLYTISNLNLSSSFVIFNTRHTTLLDDATRIYENPEAGMRPCTFLFESSPNALFLVYWPTGQVKVMIATPTWSIERTIENLPTTCTSLSFTSGYNTFYIADSITNKIHEITVSTGELKTTQLSFTPGKIALVVPEEAYCKKQITTITPGTTTIPPTQGAGSTTTPPTQGAGSTTTPPTTGPSSQARSTMSLSIIMLIAVNLVGAFIMA